jgi:UDP-N-acetylglucosamine 2-epimerase (non-hydrolysing)
MIRVLSVFGTRPEAIKMAPVVKALAGVTGITSRVCVTAQHREMLDQVLALFGITPDHDLNIMQERQSLSGVTSSALLGVERIIKEEGPDWVLVQGDTTTVLSASLAAFYQQVKVGHVEAGLRTGNKLHPFPEEINRKLCDAMADLHFAPTESARQNLLREGAHAGGIVVTGNTVIDALFDVVRQVRSEGNNRWQTPAFAGKRIIAVTAHRRENFGLPLENICAALGAIAERYADDVHIIYPVHRNPNVQDTVNRLLGNSKTISLIDPIDYKSMVALLDCCHLVLTDSGGLQEEAPSLGKPVLVLRQTTERPEAVDAGTVRVIGTDRDRIIEETSTLLDDQQAYLRMAHAVNPYGDGLASGRIVKAIIDYESRHEKGQKQ